VVHTFAVRLIAIVAFAVMAVACRAIAGLDTTYAVGTATDAGAIADGPRVETGIGITAEAGDAVAASCNQNYAALVRAQNPSAYYRFEDNFVDEVTGGAITPSGGAPLFGGPIGARGRFLDLKKQPFVAQTPPFSLNGGEMTLEYWFERQDVASCLPGVTGPDWSLKGYQAVDPKQIAYDAIESEGGAPSFNTIEPAAGWHHVVVRIRCASSCELQGILDGTPSETALTAGATAGTYSVTLGTNCGSAANRIDEVAVYPSALDDGTIAQHLLAGNCQ
jgi:hypothetical protein